VAKYSLIIAKELGLGEQEQDRLRIAALLHDVGKIGVDDRVLEKARRANRREFKLMKQHPSKGANIMRPVAQLKEMLPGIELHHECVDGHGYPYGLSGDQIPMMARDHLRRRHARCNHYEPPVPIRHGPGICA